MANIFAYNNRLWKEKFGFTIPGVHDFTLPSGEYLMMCHGATGGSSWSSYRNRGGVAYGILNLSEQKSMHAFVGGDGGNAGSTGYQIGIGGFNGGGNGGKGYQDSSNYGAGGGGGGASDIRIKTPEECESSSSGLYYPTLPAGYRRIEYFESTNKYFDTGYIAKPNTTFTASVSYTAKSNNNSEYALLGTQLNSNVSDGWVVWLNSYYKNSTPCIASIYGNTGWSESRMVPTEIPTDTKATYRIDKDGTFVNGHPAFYETTTGNPQSDATILFLANRRAGNVQTARIFSGRVYFFRIYEFENNEYVLKHEYIPAIRESDNAIGLCDTVVGSEHIFLTPSSYSTNSISAGPETSSDIEAPALTERYRPTIDTENYTQLEYFSSPGKLYFDSGYIANTSTVITFRAAPSDNYYDKAMFGSQSGSNTDPGWACWYYYATSSGCTNLASIYGTMGWESGAYFYSTWVTAGIPCFCRVEKNRTFSHLRQMIGYVPSGTPESDRTILIMDCRRGDGFVASDSSFIGKLYHFRIYETDANGNDILIHEFVPCKRNSDDVIGLYDTIEDPVTHEHAFLEPLERDSGYALVAGPEGSYPIVDYDGKNVAENMSPAVKKSLNTRIIVAGGGGGSAPWNNNTARPVYAGMGGGVYGGFMEFRDGVSPRSYATQSSGASFGFGQNGRNSTQSGTYANYGSSGGGGGWFGGYASQTTTGGSNANGGGGSGYVLTNSSYIPTDYMEDYEQFQMTHPFLGAGYAESSCVRICEPCETLHAGDIITVFGGFGTAQQIPVPPGQYRLRCWGGDGGFLYDQAYCARGGYAEGILTLPTSNTLYARVAGSGMYYDLISYDYVHQMRPDMAFNGGGACCSYGDAVKTSDNFGDGSPGGGGTDIRIGTDSVYSRVIVAGGGGGANYSNMIPNNGCYGGAGGGLTGERYHNASSSMAGVSPGPGTQTGTAPFDSNYDINGGFGYGGNSARVPGGGTRSAGGGGGGWYGGSSAYATTTNYFILGANGGSGYLFTEDSYKPEGFLLTPEYYLSDGILTQGGNDLPIGISKIEIDVLDTKIVRVLCRDQYGIKRYDESQSRWVWIEGVTEPTVELFMTYGSLVMESDNGLDTDYEILIYDPDATTSKIALNVTPNKQRIQTETTTNIAIREMRPNLDYDPSIYDVIIEARRQTLVTGTKIKTIFDVTKKARSDESAKIFYVTYSDGK